MKYEIGQKIRIKDNAVEIIKEYNKTSVYKLKLDGKDKLQGTIQIIEALTEQTKTVGIKGFKHNSFPFSAIEHCVDSRELMMEIEKIL